MATEAGNTLTWYLDRVGKVPLRTAEEEIDLAKRIRAGLAARQECERASEGADRRAVLRRIVRDGERAAALLTEANLRLVVSISRRYRGQGMDLLDLTQEGTLGLLTAVRRFDPARGFRFSTYASWWIRQAVLSALATRSRVLRMPTQAYEIAGRVRALETELFQRTGREATEEELAERLDLKPARLREIRRAAYEFASLDAPLAGTQTVTLGSTVVDDRLVGPEASVGATMARETLLRAVGSLADRERQVVELRYGLHDGRARTLEEVGDRLGITRERVRQIEQRALDKLCQPRLDGLLESAAG